MSFRCRRKTWTASRTSFTTSIGSTESYLLVEFRWGRAGQFRQLSCPHDRRRWRGRAQSYLANEENFQFMKALESKNLLVPVVGDFAGSKAIRGVRQYLRDRAALVSAFYLSNVERYPLWREPWNTFCGNFATLPLERLECVHLLAERRPAAAGAVAAGCYRGIAQSSLTSRPTSATFVDLPR